MLLTLELTGDDTQTATRTFKLLQALSFNKCTLRSVEMSVRGEPLAHDWTDAQTGAYPDGTNRTVYGQWAYGRGHARGLSVQPPHVQRVVLTA
jgi:hypothetical protein